MFQQIQPRPSFERNDVVKVPGARVAGKVRQVLDGRVIVDWNNGPRGEIVSADNLELVIRGSRLVSFDVKKR